MQSSVMTRLRLAGAITGLVLAPSGIQRADAQIFEEFPVAPGLFVDSVFERPGSGSTVETWIGTTDGVLYVDVVPRDLWNQPVNTNGIAEYGGRLWFATSRGLRSEEWDESAPHEELDTWNVVVAAGPALWAGGAGRVDYLLEDGNWRSMKLKGRVRSIVPTEFRIDGIGFLWISTSAGVFRAQVPTPLADAEVKAELIVDHISIDLLDLPPEAAQAWAVESYIGPRGVQSYKRLYRIESGGATLVEDRLLTVDHLREGELWVTKEESDKSLTVLVSRRLAKGDRSSFTPVDIPLTQLQSGYPKKILADPLEGGLWLWSTSGLYRGLEGDTDSWRRIAIPGRENVEPLEILPGARGTLWIHDPDGFLLRLHPGARVEFGLAFESLGLFSPPHFRLPGSEKNLFLAFRNEIQVVGCRYEGMTVPLVAHDSESCDTFQTIVAANRAGRDTALASWRLGRATAAEPTRHDENSVERTTAKKTLSPPSGNLLPVFAGAIDPIGHERSKDFLVLFVGWKAAVIFLVLAMLLLPPVSGLAFSLLEVLLGTRIALIGLRLPILSWLYRRRYFNKARHHLCAREMSSTQDWENTSLPVQAIGAALERDRWCLVAVPETSSRVAHEAERWALGMHGRACPKGSLGRLKLSLSRHRPPLPRLLPVRVDVGADGDTVAELDAPIVKRLKTLGGAEKRIAEFIWEHADFLLIISSSRGWDDEIAERLLRFVNLQSEDAEARFIIITTLNRADELRQKISERLHREIRVLGHRATEETDSAPSPSPDGAAAQAGSPKSESNDGSGGD